MSQPKAGCSTVRHRSEKEIEQAIKENRALVYHVLHTRFPQYVYDEDIAQIGLIGLWNAARTFDTSKSQFSTYAVTCITNNILRELRKQRAVMRTADVSSLDEPANDEPDAICKGALMPNPDDPYQVVEILDALDYIKAKMKPRDWSIFEEYLCSGKTLQQISQEHGVSHPQSSKVVNHVRRHLHAILYGPGSSLPSRAPRRRKPAIVS